MANRPTQVVLGPVRLSYAYLFEPHAAVAGNDPKYSAMLLIPKSDKKLVARMQAAYDAALSIAKAKLDKLPKNFRCPIMDGDEERDDGESWPKECRGMLLLNASASAKHAPGLVDRRCQPITDRSMLYSGVWANVDLNFYFYDAGGNRGIAAGLNNVQKVRDDEDLGGRSRPENVFKPLEDDDEDDMGL